MPETRRHPSAYVRAARASEFADVVRVLTRAFTNDPAMNWYGCVTDQVKDLDNPTPSEQKTMKNLNWFQAALAKSALMVEGFIDVIAIPSEGKQGEEEIIAVGIWLPPGKTLDLPLTTLVRAGMIKAVWGWGLTGAKRLLFNFTPAVEGTLERSFKSRNLDRLDSWHLLEMVVDPVHQGKGYTTLLMEAGSQRTSQKPIHLEATKASTRDIYAHFGFEVDEVHQFGVGAVDSKGLKSRGVNATGYPEWIMTKWST